MVDFRKGDIVRNIFAGKNNPNAYMLYIGKGTCKQGRYSHKVYDCIGYDGQKVQVFREPESLMLVGHMEEFDAFMVALKSLKDMEHDR